MLFIELNNELNPFSTLKYIPGGQELLNTAYFRASKLTLPKSKRPIHIRTREREIAKLKLIQDTLSTRLDLVVKSFPSFKDIHPFYRTLADTIVSIDDLRQSLASVTSSVRIINRIVGESRRKLSKAETPSEARQLRTAAYGRIASVIRRLEPRLEVIQRAAKEYRRFPSVDLSLPVVVVAGFPNVGKSSFVAAISSARPEIAEYPFTTKKISLGHFSAKPSGGQVLDIPGLLDRPMSERNPIERRAIAAIQYLADCIIFLFDPTLTCGYELSSQITLYREIIETFPQLEIFPLVNKSDIASEVEIHRVTELLNKKDLPVISTFDRAKVSNLFHDILRRAKRIQEKLTTLQEQLRQP